MKRWTDQVEDLGGSSAGHADITSIDVFAGAGGLTTGLHLGDPRIRTVRAVEHDVAAAATFAANHGADRVFAGGIEEWLEEETVPDVDLVVGGPPCQGFSQLNRAKVGIERNALWEKYAQTIALAKPRWFVMENVSTFLRSPEYAELCRWAEPGGILQDWIIDARVLLAADYGAPQRRRRTVVLGHRRDAPAPRWPAPTHERESFRTVGDAFDNLRRGVVDVDLPRRVTVFGDQTLPGTFRTDELHLTRNYEPKSKKRFRAIPAGGNRFDLPDHLLSPCWRKHLSGSGDVMGRLEWDKPSVTIRTEFFKPEKGRYLHPTEHRAITHQEAARIQGFPDDYLWVGSKVAIARQIGNAVPVALGAALGRSIAAAADKMVARR